MAKHSIVHIEWNSRDLKKAKAFYGGLFGWKFKTWGEGENYVLFSAPEGPGGGLQKVKSKKEVGAGKSPLVYVEVDEIKPYLEKAKRLGGGVATPKTEIPNVGWFALLKDPDGNIVGLFQERSEK